MTLTRRSKIKDVWQHPVGHDLVQILLRQHGRSEKWVTNPLVANLSILALDRLAGDGFTDTLLELAALEADGPRPPQPEQHAWWKEAVIYQIFLPSFMDSDHDGIGDLGGVLQRLPYLENLGVDALWLWPLLDVAAGGGIRNYREIHQEYGQLHALDTLVKAAHARNMKIIIGLDISATSDQHPWFQKALEGQEQDYYIFQKGSGEQPPNNWSRAPKGEAWKYYADVGLWALRLTGKHRMDVNWENPKVRAEMADILRFWLDKGIDGFCLGSVNLISKECYADGATAAMGVTGMCGYERYCYGPQLHHHLHELRQASGLTAPALTMGEVRGVGTEMAKLLTGEDRQELDMILDSAHLAQKPKSKVKSRTEEEKFDLQELKSYYLQWMERYGAERWMTLFLENAKTPRLVSRVGASPVYRGILAKLLGTLLLTLRGTPCVYQGEELGLTNTRFLNADELRDKTTLRQYSDNAERLGPAAALEKALATTPDHARTPIPWSNAPHGGFTGAHPWMRLPDGIEYLNAAAQMQDSASVWHHYRSLISLRKQNKALVYGSFHPVFANNKKVFCYFRILEGEKLYIEMNLTEKEAPRPGRILQTQKLALSNYDTPARSLRPYEANVYLCDQ